MGILPFLLFIVGLSCLIVGAIQIGRAGRQDAEFIVGSYVRTERGKQDIYFSKHAIRALGNDLRFRWFYDEEKLKSGASGALKIGILSELGRLEDDDLIRSAAAKICKMDPKPTTQNTITMLRQWRLGRNAEPALQGIKKTIANAIDNYLYVHPTTARDMIQEALRDISEIVEDWADL